MMGGVLSRVSFWGFCKMTDNVNHPKHYTQQPHECIEFTEHLDFCLGNVFKYVFRYGQKNGVEDLKKARWYLSRVIEQELPLELDNEIWAEGNEKLAECNFTVEQEQILRTLWFLAQGVGAWRVYDDLAEVSGLIGLWIAKLEVEGETGVAPVA